MRAPCGEQAESAPGAQLAHSLPRPATRRAPARRPRAPPLPPLAPFATMGALARPRREYGIADVAALAPAQKRALAVR